MFAALVRVGYEYHDDYFYPSPPMSILIDDEDVYNMATAESAALGLVWDLYDDDGPYVTTCQVLSLEYVAR